MSEIFTRLKETKFDKKTASVVAAHGSVQLFPQAHGGEVVTEEPPVGQIPVVQPLPALRRDASFDLGAADHRILTVLEPFTLVGEQFRLLRAKLSLMQKESGIKTVLVTSSVAAEGKTFTACCLAGVFSQEPGKRVVLIDADLRKPTANHSLGMHGPAQLPGLSQVLRGEQRPEDVLLESSSTGFFLMPAGPIPDNPAELLSSPMLEQVLKQLTGYFDWIILDSPPVLALADATLIAPICDATALVVRTGKTPATVVKEAINRLGRGKICGIVLNRGKDPRTSRYYCRYYHKG